MKHDLEDVLNSEILNSFLGGTVYYTSPRNDLSEIPMFIESIYLGPKYNSQIMIYTPSPVPTFPPPPALLGFDIDNAEQVEELEGGRMKFRLMEDAECIFCPPAAKEVV